MSQKPMAVEQATEMLQARFESVYCPTCNRAEGGNCEGCHRKAMYWGISEAEARAVAKLILGVTE